MTAKDWLDLVREQERRGEYLVAVDLAEQGLAENPGDRPLQHRLVLALARAGATQQASRRFDGYGLRNVHDDEIAALGARIAKDTALALPNGDARRAAAAAAAAEYAEIYSATGGSYPAVNAATLRLVAGDLTAARELAAEVLSREVAKAGDPEDYYREATIAEAQRLVGDVDLAHEALCRAVATNAGDHSALATTRRQLRLICRCLDLDLGVLDVLAGPGVAHFCGHIDAGDAVAARIREVVEAESIGYAYGALAAGADILWAEALLDAGADVHVILPFGIADFVEASVAPSGPEWVTRFHAVLARCRDVTFATDDEYLGDEQLFGYGSQVAMGLALSRARYLDAKAVQFAVWDSEPAGDHVGTAVDVARWRRTGNRTVVVPVERPEAPQPTKPNDRTQPGPGRVIQALLVGDLQGFSALTDAQFPAFAEHVLGAFARAVAKYSDHVQCVNTWGDGLLVVIDDVEQAAECALALQQELGMVNLADAGLPESLALRLGAHVGPMYAMNDPVTGRANFFGSHISRAARVEPITPAGEVYVTAEFAATLALVPDTALVCDYVGHLPMAKGYGPLRMHRLHRPAH